jgi:hypothetical protein
MGKYLEALKLMYGDEEKKCETVNSSADKTDKSPFVSNVSFIPGDIENFSDESVPFSDHEIAEHMIDTEVHRDDRSFVRQQLIGAYGTVRLKRVEEYMEQFRIGSESVDAPHKKSNAGRKRANTWIREN